MHNHLEQRLEDFPNLKAISSMWEVGKDKVIFTVGPDKYAARTPAEVDACLMRALWHGERDVNPSSAKETLRLALFLAGIYVESIDFLPFKIDLNGLHFGERLIFSSAFKYTIKGVKNMITLPMAAWLQDGYREDLSDPNLFFSLKRDGLLTTAPIPPLSSLLLT